MRTISLSSRKTAMAAAATLSLAIASAAGIALAPAANATAAALTLSAASGASGGTNSLTATSLASTFSTGFAAEFQYKASASTTCSATYAAAVTLATGVGIVPVVSPHLLTSKKIALTVPVINLVPGGVATSDNYLLCVYSGSIATTSPLTASAGYSVAAAPGTPTILPVSGPAVGGGTVTVSGSHFVAGTTAKIGTVPLTGVVLASDGLSLTGVVPPQAAGAALAVSVSNSGGTTTATLPAGQYTYTNGITVNPNTTTSTTATDVDVQGVGFSSLAFGVTTGAAIDSSGAHVYITNGDYLSAVTTKTHPEIGECLNVLVISDTELICSINPVVPDGLGATLAALTDGTYTVTVVSAGDAVVHTVGTAGYSESIVSSGSTFTVAPY